MRQLQIIDLFLHTLSENNPKLIRFAIGGICNLSLGKLYNKIEKINIILRILIYYNKYIKYKHIKFYII